MTIPLASLRATAALMLGLAAVPALAQTCPFDDGNAQLTREGVVLTRYALGLTGAALVNGTGFAAGDATTIASNIACPSCGLNITGNVDGGGNPVVTVADATIISRRLAGMQGAALTNGLALGSGPRNTPAAVQSFLLAGCGGAPSNAWTNGGNSFGGVGTIGTLDDQQLEVRSGGNAVKLLLSGQNGLRVLRSYEGNEAESVAVVNGSANNSVGLTPYQGATVAGGGVNQGGCLDPLGTSRSCGNVALAGTSTVGGGLANRATGTSSTIAGGSANTVLSLYSTIGGGGANIAQGESATVPGGRFNHAVGVASLAAGHGAIARGHNSFVWGDLAGGYDGRFDPAQLGSFGATPGNPSLLNNTFIVRAVGGVQFVTGLNAGGGIGSTCWINPGGSGWNCSSDRALKHAIEAVSPRNVLARLLQVPVSTWAFLGSERRQIGPMAQDFYRAFGLGDSDRAINSVDAQGVAFAAIQGLHAELLQRDQALAKLRRDRDADAAVLRELRDELRALRRQVGR